MNTKRDKVGTSIAQLISLNWDVSCDDPIVYRCAARMARDIDFGFLAGLEGSLGLAQVNKLGLPLTADANREIIRRSIEIAAEKRV